MGLQVYGSELRSSNILFESCLELRYKQCLAILHKLQFPVKYTDARCERFKRKVTSLLYVSLVYSLVKTYEVFEIDVGQFLINLLQYPMFFFIAVSQI